MATKTFLLFSIEFCKNSQDQVLGNFKKGVFFYNVEKVGGKQDKRGEKVSLLKRGTN